MKIRKILLASELSLRLRILIRNFCMLAYASEYYAVHVRRNVNENCFQNYGPTQSFLRGIIFSFCEIIAAANDIIWMKKYQTDVLLEPSDEIPRVLFRYIFNCMNFGPCGSTSRWRARGAPQLVSVENHGVTSQDLGMNDCFSFKFFRKKSFERFFTRKWETMEMKENIRKKSAPGDGAKWE